MNKWILVLLTTFLSQAIYSGSSGLQHGKKILTIAFKNTINGKPVKLDEMNYLNNFKEEFSIHAIRYYISSIEIIDNNDRFHNVSDSTFLIDEADSISKDIRLETTAIGIKGVRFLVGVDSIKNTQGVQNGTLDPEKGMFWTWNSGYVMAKFEGSSPVARTPAQRFSYHVGGYRQNENAVRKITCLLDTPFTLHNPSTKLCITAEVLKWFNGIHNIKLAEQAVCHSPGVLAMQLADNYAGMFHIDTTGK